MFDPNFVASIRFHTLQNIIQKDTSLGYGAFVLLTLYITEAQHQDTICPSLTTKDAAQRMSMKSVNGVLQYRKLLKELNLIEDVRIKGMVGNTGLCARINPDLFDIEHHDDVIRIPFWVYDKFITNTTPRKAQQAFCLEAYYQYISGIQNNSNLIFLQGSHTQRELGISSAQYIAARDFLVDRKRIEYTTKRYCESKDVPGSSPYRTETKIKLKFLMKQATHVKVQASRGSLAQPKVTTATGLVRKPVLKKKPVRKPVLKKKPVPKIKLSRLAVKYLTKNIRFVKKEIDPFVKECKILLASGDLPENRRKRIESRMSDARTYRRQLMKKGQKPNSRPKPLHTSKKKSQPMPEVESDVAEILEFWNAQPNLKSHKLQGSKLIKHYLKDIDAILHWDFYGLVDAEDNDQYVELLLVDKPFMHQEDGFFTKEEVITAIENLNKIATDPNTAPWEVKQIKTLGIHHLFYRKGAKDIDDLDWNTSEIDHARYLYPFLAYAGTDIGRSQEGTVELTIPSDKHKCMWSDGKDLAQRLNLDLDKPSNRDLIKHAMNRVFPLFGNWNNKREHTNHFDPGEYAYQEFREQWVGYVYQRLSDMNCDAKAMIHNWFWDAFLSYMRSRRNYISFNDGAQGRDTTADVADVYNNHTINGELYGCVVSKTTQFRFTFMPNGAYFDYPKEPEVLAVVKADIHRLLTSAELSPVAVRDLKAELKSIHTLEVS